VCRRSGLRLSLLDRLLVAQAWVEPMILSGVGRSLLESGIPRTAVAE
jgi:hypothetical protein